MRTSILIAAFIIADAVNHVQLGLLVQAVGAWVFILVFVFAGWVDLFDAIRAWRRLE